jgi:predicted ATP-grasp superfamily ATP-dependent carboligase
MPTGTARPPVLLTRGDYYGTLAAARCLGDAGVPVELAEWRRFVPARWSRHVTRRLRCPDLDADPAGFVDWLLAEGEREPGRVLLPASDDLAWLYAQHREALSRHFLLDIPALATVHTLLDKWRLRAAAAEVGLASPATWLPQDEAEVARLAPGLPYPIMVKPRLQAFLRPLVKGRLVFAPAELAATYRRYRATVRHGPILSAHDPSVERPLLQAFDLAAVGHVYSLCGYVDAGGGAALSASRKTFQRPRRVGVGLSFEEEEVAPRLADQLLALCRRVGYHGMFEAEFLRSGGRDLLIDFNPRLYGQLQFDVARGLPLPLLAYLDAVGDDRAQHQALEAARRAGATTSGRVFCHRLELHVYLATLRLLGRITRGEARAWRAWLRAHRHAPDFTWHPGDRLPALVDLALSLSRQARHPRATLRIAWRD